MRVTGIFRQRETPKHCSRLDIELTGGRVFEKEAPMHEMRISRRGFLTQSSMIATVGATAPFLSASPLLLEQQTEGTPGAAESSSHQHHVVVPLYRAGKLIENVSGDPAQVGSHVILRILNDDGF